MFWHSFGVMRSMGEPKRIEGAGSLMGEQGLGLGEGVFDGIEVGALGRQARAAALNRGAHTRTLVAAGIVHADDVAGPQFAQQGPLDPGF